MGKINNTNFFKEPIDSSSQNDSQAKISGFTEESVSVSKPIRRIVQLRKEVITRVKDTASTLNQIGLKALGQEVSLLYKKVMDEHFTVAFVGEFGKGKSTIINNLLGNNVLPTGTLPTTAILTRIKYGEKGKIIVVQRDGKTSNELPLVEKSWEGLTAANFGEKEPDGYVTVETNNPWLGTYGIVLLDTPGAGDLSEKRAKIIERCVIGADAAIITISADKILSLTEQTFIRHKIMSRGIPFVAIALTKLDLINEEDRCKVISFLFKKLESLKIKVPVIIASDEELEIPNLNCPVAIGFESLKAMIVAWMSHEKRQELTEKWLISNVENVLNIANATLTQQKAIFDADEDNREKLISERNIALSKVHKQWQDLRDEMQKRCETCISSFNQKAYELGNSITEAIQHEARKQPAPKDWLENEYAYRVKSQFAAMSVTLDNLVTRQLSSDIKWLNSSMSKQFKEMVNVDIEGLCAKDDFLPEVNEKSLRFDDLKDKSMQATVVSSVVTLGTALLLGATGAAPLIFATMGVGTGANIISKKLLEKKGSQQRDALIKLVGEDIPRIIRESSKDSAIKIRILYNNVINESMAVETRWMQTQRTIIRQSIITGDKVEAAENLDRQIKEVNRLREQLSK